MNQATYLNIIRMAKKRSGMVRLVYEGENGKANSAVLYLTKYPDTDGADKAVKVLKSKDKKPEDFLDRVSVGNGYLLVTLGKMRFSEDDLGASCIRGWYLDRNGLAKTGYIYRDHFGVFSNGTLECTRAIPFERIISIGF